MSVIKEEADSEITIAHNVPAGFDQNEWEKLIEGWLSEQLEIDYWIAQRGQGTSRQGRPTHFQATYKGELSSTSRAIQQRDKAAQRSAEQKALDTAGASDRAARHALKKKINKDEEYRTYSDKKKEIVLQSMIEDLNQNRFDHQQSREWLENKFYRVHLKWKKIRTIVAQRQHETALAKLSEKQSENKKKYNSRADRRLFGPGGALERIMRTVYEEGAEKLKTDDCNNEDAQKEWQGFVDSLNQDELAMVTDKDWKPREPTPPPEYTYEGDDIFLRADRPYIEGSADDECEEEIDDDDDSDIDKWYNEGENEYETEEQHMAIMDQANESNSEDSGAEDEDGGSMAETSDVEMED